jgi:hypothetical protein
MGASSRANGGDGTALCYNTSSTIIANCPGSGTEIIPGKQPDTRIKPLPLTKRALVSVGKWPLHIYNRNCINL